MTRMTGPDCVVMCNLINTHTHTHAHAERETSSGSRKTRRPSENAASCGGPEPRDGMRGTRPASAEERRRSAKKNRRVVGAM